MSADLFGDLTRVFDLEEVSEHQCREWGVLPNRVHFDRLTKRFVGVLFRAEKGDHPLSYNLLQRMRLNEGRGWRCDVVAVGWPVPDYEWEMSLREVEKIVRGAKLCKGVRGLSDYYWISKQGVVVRPAR